MLDRGSNTPKNHAHLSDLINLSSDDSFGGGHGAVNTRTEIFGNNGLAASAADEEGGSGASTPPLWAGSGSPESRQTNYESLSPRSRTEAIVRGQMELMEMVKSMPESCYELSLKDLVEVNRNVSQERLLEGRQGHIGGQASHGGAQAQQQHRHHQMVRSGSLDGSSGGFLLKVVFPVPWRARKKRDAKIGKTRAASLSSSAHGNSTKSSGESGSLEGGSRKGSNGSINGWSSRSSSTISTRYIRLTICITISLISGCKNRLSTFDDGCYAGTSPTPTAGRSSGQGQEQAADEMKSWHRLGACSARIMIHILELLAPCLGAQQIGNCHRTHEH